LTREGTEGAISPIAREMIDGLAAFNDCLASGQPIEERFKVTHVCRPKLTQAFLDAADIEAEHGGVLAIGNLAANIDPRPASPSGCETLSPVFTEIVEGSTVGFRVPWAKTKVTRTLDRIVLEEAKDSP
jgi:hypothetical protein